MNCAQCGSDNPAGKKFCGDCGGALETRCPQCGAENPPNEREKHVLQAASVIGKRVPLPL